MMQQVIDFNFPTDEEQFRIVVDLQDLKYKLQKEEQAFNIMHQTFRLCQPKMNYIYAYCKSCNSRIKYRKNNQQFRLIRFSNHHHHQLKIKSNKDKMIEGYIARLPLSLSLSSRKAMTKQQFGINDRKFYYIHHKIVSLTSDFYQLAKKLDQQRYQSRFKPFPLVPKLIPDVFITSSPTMRENYQKYGQFISIDVTYNLVKEKSFGVGWGVCLILGMNSHHHIIPFAVAIMNNQSQQSFSQLFLSFFQIMGRQPQTILSDEQMSIKSSLSRLQEDGVWSGVHLFDKYHIFKNLRKKLKQSGDILTILRDSVLKKDRLQFQKEVQKAYRLVSSEYQAKTIKQFVDKSDKFSLANTPQTFFGVSISTSFGQKANDIIKSYMEFQLPAVRCVTTLLKVCKVLQEKALSYKICSIKYENVMQDNQLKMIRFQYCQKVFEVFMINYVESLKLRYQQIDQDHWKVLSPDKDIENQQVNLLWNVLRCSCGMQVKQGIPCSHILLLCRHYHSNYSDYFHERWKIIINQPSNKKNKYLSNQEVTIRKGRPKFSRRNVL